MRFLIAAALLAATATTPPAFAQDDADKPFQGVKVLAIAAVDRVDNAGEGETGFGYGGTVGYDFQARNLVFGVEGEVTGSTAKRCAYGVVVPNDILCEQAGRDLYAGARAGVVIGKRVLLFVKGGYTNARAVTDYSNTTPANNFLIGENLDGWRAGTGIELNLGKSFIARAEYRYSRYEQDFSRQQGVLGVGFRF